MWAFKSRNNLMLFLGLYLLVGIGVFFFVDLPVARFFRVYENTWFEDGLTFLSIAGESHWFILSGLATYIIYRKRQPLFAKYGLFIVGSVAISGIISGLIKITVGRFRPVKYFREDLYGFDGWHFNDYKFNSFPSGHTTTGFAVGVALALLYPRYAAIFIGFGFFVAFTRVATTVHYVSDTMGGALIGTAVACFLYTHYIKGENSPCNRI